MDAAYRSTKSPFSGASPTQLVGGKFAHDFAANNAVHALEKNEVLAAALSEYCRLKADGTTPKIQEFCRRYPTYHKSIQRMIDVEETLGKLDDLDDLDEVEWPEVGSSFMGFDVLHELGVGAFARVYLASEPALGGRLVAVKVAMYGGDEAETLGKLVHPNVVPVHSVCNDSESGMTAVCMPYLGSATLSDVIEQVFQDGVPSSGKNILQAVARREVVGQSAASPADAEVDTELNQGSYVDGVVRLGIQMAEALVYTHAKGVLHRDLKPSNVLITPAGQPKLLDFNLSCDVETEVHRLGGTLPYMPPEQINDVFLKPFDAKPPTDPRSDIFSLGVILYELFTGELPFGDPPSNIPPIEAGKIYRHSQQRLRPRPIQELNPAVGVRMSSVVERCILPDPESRPADATQLVTELAKHFSPVRRVQRWASTHKGMLAAVGVVIFASLLSLVWYYATRPTLDRRLYNSGLYALKRGDHTEATSYFDQALELNPQQPAIHLARGLCFRALDDHIRARKDFMPIAKGDCDPIVKEVYAYSYLESATEESFGAIVPYQELHKRIPDDLRTLVNLAYAKYTLVHVDRNAGQALSLANEILEKEPTCASAHYIRALCTYEYLTNGHGDAVDVLQDVETALAMGPSNGDMELYRIHLLKQIAGDDPYLRDALVADTKLRINRIAPHFQQSTLNRIGANLGIENEPWFNSAKKLCRTEPELKPMSYIAFAPSQEAIQDYLRRDWE